MTTTKTARQPTGLGSRGARLWKDVSSQYDMRVDELRILESAARTLDETARLERALAHEDVIVKGSRGQARAHPLVASIDGHRRLFAALLKQIDLPDPEADGQRSALSEKRSKAANVRWNRVRAQRAAAGEK